MAYGARYDLVVRPFAEIEQTAAARIGGAKALAAILPIARSADDLRADPDDRYLSQMCRRIFRAGLRHSLIDAKWPAFEKVFFGFDPYRIRAMPDEELEALMGDTRIIRHWGKIKSVRANAAAILEISSASGCFGAYLAAWPESEIVDLWAELTKRFQQLGGNSGPTFLRMVGKDTFLLTPDVVRALSRWGAYDGPAKSKRDRRAIQDAFNSWREQSGHQLCQISRILALSVG